MKMIQRYVNLNGAFICASGVYTGNLTISADAQFNLVVNLLKMNFTCADTVTSQQINAMAVVLFRINSSAIIFRDNPGFLTASQGLNILTSYVGRVASKSSHISLAAGERLQCVMTFNLNIVTANSIRNDGYITLGYMCPEDYLSMPGFE